MSNILSLRYYGSVADKLPHVYIFTSGAQFSKHKCNFNVVVKTWNQYFLHLLWSPNNLISVALLKCWKIFMPIKTG